MQKKIPSKSLVGYFLIRDRRQYRAPLQNQDTLTFSR